METANAILPERAKEIIDHLPVTVYRTTPDGRILEGNAAVEDLLGYTVEEFTTMHANDLYFRPEDRGPFMKQRLDDDYVRTVLRLKRKDGTAIWAEDIGRAIKNSRGDVEYFDGTLVDITDQVETERALRDREAMLSTIHDKAPIAIFNLGPDGRVFQANPQAHTMLGLGPGELIGKSIAEFTYEEDAKESQEAFMRLKDGEADEVELDKRYRRADGKAIWGNVRAVAVRNPDGSFSHTISLVQDITQRKRTEDAFRLLDDLTHRVTAAADLEQALKDVLDGICESIGFSYGEAWLPDSDGNLVLSPAWHGDEGSRDMLKFRHLSQKLNLNPGEGLPGRAAQEGHPIWTEDLAHDQANVRAATAASAGLKCALCLPVSFGDVLVAVLMFMDAEREKLRDSSMRLMQFLADRLGATVARRRLEVRLEEQAHILETQMDGASEGILVTSSDGRIITVNRRFLAMCGVPVEEYDASIPAMDVLADQRGHPEILANVRHMYEDRTTGKGSVELDDEHSFDRRAVTIGETGGQVWYFTPVKGGSTS